MGMEAQEGNAPERTQSGRQNSGAGRRQNNYRGRRNDHAKASAFGQSANAAQANGYTAAEQRQENGDPSNDTASIDRHILKLSSEAASLQEEIMHYKRIVDERSELRKLQAELQSTKEGAEATRQYHLTSVNHLEEKLKATESECDEMRNRLRAIHEAAEQKDATLKQFEACIAQRDAVDRERNGHIEELSRKLSHAHATSEQYRSQAEATNKRLTQAEEAKRAVETELSNLKLEVQAHSDSRKLEEAARMAGLQQAQKDYDSLVKENQGSITFLETQLQESQAERSRMEAHYRKECERLCKIIDAERSKPLAPLLSDKDLLALVSANLPMGEENAVQLGPSLIETLQKAIWPNTWEHHYATAHGSVFDFMAAHPRQCMQRSDGAFYRPQPAIRFGSATLDQLHKSQDASAQGKRVMTAQERTVGPPPISSSSSLLNRLQRTSNSASSAAPQATPLEPAQSVFGQQHQAEAQGGPKEATSQHAMPQPSSQAQPVIVTPINMQARANSKGPGPQSSNAGGQKQRHEEKMGPRQAGWSSNPQKPGQPEQFGQNRSGAGPQEAGSSGQQEQSKANARKQGSRSEGAGQPARDSLPPGMSQGRQRSTPLASAAEPSLVPGRVQAPPTSQPSQQAGAGKNGPPGQASQNSRQEGQRPGQGSQKDTRSKQQPKRQQSSKELQEEPRLNLPPGFETAGQRQPVNAPVHKQDRQQRSRDLEGPRQRAEGSPKASRQRVEGLPKTSGSQSGAQGKGAALASAANGGELSANGSSKSASAPHPSWADAAAETAQPQRQQRNRRKGNKEAL